MTTTTSSDALDGTPQELDGRTRVLWVVRASLAVGFLALAGAVALSFVNVPAAAVLLGAGLLLGIAVSVVWAQLAWTHWRWSTWSDAIELHYGVVSRHASLVPFHRIQQIDVNRGPLERALGLSGLVLRTAAATSDARIPGIAAEDAETLRHRLLARAGIDDAV